MDENILERIEKGLENIIKNNCRNLSDDEYRYVLELLIENIKSILQALE